MAIYLIQNTNTLSIKIGYTNGDPMVRLKCLQTSCCGELRLLVCIPGELATEQELHKVCSEFKIRNEWFTLHCIEPFQAFFKGKLKRDNKTDLTAAVNIVRRQIKKLSSENIPSLKHNLNAANQELQDALVTIKKQKEEITYWRNVSRFALEDKDLTMEDFIKSKKQILS